MINITVSGNVGKDSELKNLNGYNCLCFSIASTKKVKGENQTIWVNCKIWGERSEKLQPYILKGTSMVVNGDASVNAYIKQDGTADGSINVNVTDFQFMSKAETKSESSQNTNATPANFSMVQNNNLGEDLPF